MDAPTNLLADLRLQTATAVRQAAQELRSDGDKLFAFALCTDDDVRTLYHVACTPDWVDENVESDPGIGFNFCEWTHSADDAPFSALNEQLDALADAKHISDDAWSAARDARFQALVLALKDCREAGIFDADTLLCAGSTDPSDHLEALAMRGVDLLNSRALADQYAQALGFEKHRRQA